MAGGEGALASLGAPGAGRRQVQVRGGCRGRRQHQRYECSHSSFILCRETSKACHWNVWSCVCFPALWDGSLRPALYLRPWPGVVFRYEWMREALHVWLRRKGWSHLIAGAPQLCVTGSGCSDASSTA